MDCPLKQDRRSLMRIELLCGGIRLAVNGDGNCTGTSWMVCWLIWTAQELTGLGRVVGKLEEAKQCNAFSGRTSSEEVISPPIHITILDVLSRLPPPASPLLLGSTKTLISPPLCCWSRLGVDRCLLGDLRGGFNTLVASCLFLSKARGL